MCGIATIYSFSNKVSSETLQHSLKTLIHRGPDNLQCWISPDEHVGLGHARLSIIDLIAGNQPIANEDETLHVVVNGEFYGYESIMQDLQKRGHRFRTQSDSEIVLHLYEEYGKECLSYLRGEFAFVLWDQTQNTIFAVRDRFGIKPLFYALHNNALYIASEIKVILAAGVPARWNREYFIHFIRSIIYLENNTFFEGVYQVPPANYLIAKNPDVTLNKYWDFNFPLSGELPIHYSATDYVNRFRDIFDEAVSLRMRADVPVGCYLSGGLDSSAVLGFMSRYAKKPIKCFTLTFDAKAYDESAVAQEMAAFTGAEYCPIPIKQSDLARNFADAIWHCETIFGNCHGISKFMLSRAVKQAGYKVVLTGEGADEILAGYPHFRRDMLLYNTEGQDPRIVRQLLDQLQRNNSVSQGFLMPHGGSGSLKYIELILGFVPSWIESCATIASKLDLFLKDDCVSNYSGKDGCELFLKGFDIQGQLRGRDFVNQSLYLWAKSALPNYILNLLGDRMEMAHSVEGRLPFLDHHLVEYLSSTPVPMKINGMTEKYLLREAARPYITETIYRRQKTPFLAPPATLSPGEPLYALLQDTLRGKSLSKIPFFDQGKVLNILDKLPEMAREEKIAFDTPLMFILSTCILRDQFNL